MRTQIGLAALAASTLALASSVQAQVGVDVGVGVDADVGVGVDADVGADVRIGEPYTYRGYRSGRWYPEDRPRRRGRWYDRYDGYDCYGASYYTWSGRHRVRWESTWCFDEDGDDYEVRRTRVVTRLD